MNPDQNQAPLNAPQNPAPKTPFYATKTAQQISSVIVILLVVGLIAWATRSKNSEELADVPVIQDDSSGLADQGTIAAADVDARDLSEPAANAPKYRPSLAEVVFNRQNIKINPGISQDFSISEITNIADMEKAYGFTFSPQERAKLEHDKFVVKNLLDTPKIAGDSLSVRDNDREFVALYSNVSGKEYKSRTGANALFISSDSLMNLFSIISVDLLKETENKYLSEQLTSVTKSFLDLATEKFNKATTAQEKTRWAKVRDYFAVPYAILSTSLRPFSVEKYYNSKYYKEGISVESAMAGFAKEDAAVDSYENAAAVIKKLKLEPAEESAVLEDLSKIYAASEARGTPTIFKEEIAKMTGPIKVQVPFTLFKPRGTYTSSSLRRQYFRAVQWYQQIPFFEASPELTNYAVSIGQLAAGDKAVTDSLTNFSSMIAFVVGDSDDLDVLDYAAAYKDLGNNAYNATALSKYLDSRKPPSRIKAMPVSFGPDSKVTREDEIKAIRGMRLMSQKFIPDSYWTSMLTQGDEMPAVNGKRLSDKASMLEVMSLLGSNYATSHLSDLSFYAAHKEPTDTVMGQLKKESAGWGNQYWMSNLYTSSMWTISGLYEWLTANKTALPKFMQGTSWEAKTLLTGAGFWTELRHTSLLYAKQSFAEMGGGVDDACDPRKVPEPAKGYVEPQAEAYDRLEYAAKKMNAEYSARGYELKNLIKVREYIVLLDMVREYTKLELENQAFAEKVVAKNRTADGKACTEYFIADESAIKRTSGLESASRWEELRTGIIAQMIKSLTVPVEGPVLPIKDKRAALVADIHTDKSGAVLEEGTGVPRVIFVAVKDANGPRLTVGFTYSQYETESGTRLTDEEWQSRFYANSQDYEIKYLPKAQWPQTNTWFRELLGDK